MLKRNAPLLILISILLVILTACGGGAAATPTATPRQPSPSPPPPAPTPTQTAATPTPGTGNQTGGTQVTVALQDPGKGGSYSFSPSTFNFRVGETVNFTLISGNEFHTFTVEELGIDESVDAGQTVRFSFTFNTAGTYRLICIPHESLGMVGTIIVK